MKYIIFDLEATCWENRSNQNISEIIEIGAVCINAEGAKESEFSAFIKPKLNPMLSDFCTQLTSIKQSDVDAAEDFETVLPKFLEWIGEGQPFWLCSWGFYDCKQLKQDCTLHNLSTAWLKNHISLKHQHGKIKNLNRPLGMDGALRMEGLQLIGTHHRGIDDARNISSIFLKHFNSWEYK